MASKFENRIDYVDISAYGIGKVKVDHEEPKSDELEELEDQTMGANNSTHSRVFAKICNLEESLNNIKYSISSLADRHDEKMSMIMGKTPIDKMQKALIKKLYEGDKHLQTTISP